MKARNRSLWTVAALLIAVLAMSVVVPVAAQGGGRDFTAAGSDAAVVSPDINVAAARRADGSVSVILKLASEPAYVAFVAAGGRGNRVAADAAASGRSVQISAEQAAVSSAVTALGGRVTGTFQFLNNAIVVEIAPDKVESLAKIAGVVAIGPNRTYAREHTTSMPLIRASDVWNGSFTGGSYTGEGVVVAVIDEGIDYTHAHFGGPENYATNDPLVIGEAGMTYWPPVALPDTSLRQMKVIGGYDYVGDDYDAGGSGAALIPAPDPDPIGCPYAHGTHVAGTIAGYGVDAAGATFMGNYTDGDALFPAYPLSSLAQFRIGPGAAPEALLVSLRVFGCLGSVNTDILLAALEDAGANTYLGTEDVDVVNMSLGSAYGGTGPDDFMNVAQEALAAIGVTVVASAGNSGDFLLVHGAPSSASTTISVANVVDSAAVIDGVFIYDPDNNPLTINNVTVAAAPGAMYTGADPLSGGIVMSDDGSVAVPGGPATGGTLTDACQVPLGGPFTGLWVVADRGTCSFSVKVANIKAAGAAGAIIVNNAPDAPFTMGQTAGFDDLLPSAMIGQTDGTTLKGLLPLPAATSGTFDGSQVQTVSDILFVPSTSTSRGGALRGNGDIILKPNIAGPGSSITSAGAGTNDGGYTIGGTSMSSPHIAGGVALMIEKFGEPLDGNGVALIKQRLMNTATQDLYNSVASPAPFHSPQRVGAGFADFVNALNTELVAFATDAPENTSLSFGYPRALVGTTPTVSKTITVQNFSGAAMTLATGYSVRSDWGGAVVSVSPAFVTVPATGTALVTVTLTLNATQSNLNVGGDPLFSITGKTILHEESGYVTLTPISGSQTAIRVPVYAAPHLTSDMYAETEVEIAGDTGSSYVLLSGDGFDLGPDANDHLSLVSAYQLLATDGVETGLFWDADNSGTDDPDEELTDYSYADVEYVGADLQASSATRNYLYVGIGMHGEWNSPRDLFVEVYVDVDNDTVDDYVWYYGSGASDSFSVSFVPLADGGAYSFGNVVNYFAGQSFDSMLLKNNVLVMPVIVTDTINFGDPGFPNWVGGPINVTVLTYQRDSDFSFPIDTVSGVYEQSIAFGASPWKITRNLYANLDGATLDFDYDVTGLSPLPQIMTIHHQNDDAESRVQITDLAQITGETFALLSPADDAYVRDAADVTEATWEELTGAATYTFTLTQLSVNTRASGDQIVVWATAAADADDLTCAAGVCTLDLSAASLEDGTYSWSVIAAEDPFDVEASNNDFGFTVESNDLNLIADPGFEGCVAGLSPSWTGACKIDVLKANSGNAYFKGAANKFISQSITHPALEALGLGDLVTLGGFFDGKAAAKTVAVLKVKYNDLTAGLNSNGKDKIKVKLTVNTVGYEDHSLGLTLDGTVSSATVKFGSLLKKVNIDDVYLTNLGVNGPELRAEGALPPPAAPSGFRGNN